MRPFKLYICLRVFHRHFTLIVCHNLPPVCQLLTLFEVATKTPQEAPPKLGRGALCADSMGLYVLNFSVPTRA